jgi:hypothetical protein
MDQLKVVNLPRKISIWAGNAGEIVLGTGDVGDPQRVVTNLSYGGSFFGGGSASVTVWEPSGVSIFPRGGGVWRIRIDDVDCFYGFYDKSHAERIAGGYLLTFQLVDLLTAWDLTLNNILPTGHTTENPSTTFTLSDALSWMINGDGTAEYPGVTDATMGNIPFIGTMPTTSVLVRDQYEDKVLVISKSTYLAEIQKLAQLMGVTVYQNPSQKAITCADALTPGLGSFSYEEDRLKEASFDVDNSTIPATVLIVDDATSKAAAYGKSGATSDLLNFQMTGRNNLAYCSVIGVDDDKLVDMAKDVYDVARHASQVLTFIYAGLEPDKKMLGKSFVWQDNEGRSGTYCCSSFTVNLTPSSVYTTIGAYVV